MCSGTVHELRTKEGQLIRITIPFGAELSSEQLDKFAASMNKIEVPTTKWVGGDDRFERLSRFKLVPLCDEQGKPLFDGFSGVLRIVDPPEGRHGVVVYLGDQREVVYAYGYVYTSSFFEFETEQQAIAAWQLAEKKSSVELEKLPGCMRRAHCGPFKPWFYAVADQAIVGDTVLPRELNEWWIFRFGKKFVVHPEAILRGGDGIQFPKIKICWGTRAVEEEHGGMYSGGYKKRIARYALWDDGSVSYLGPDDAKELPRGIEILKGENLLAHKVLSEAEEIVAGMKDAAEVVCGDGSRIEIKWISADKKKHYKETEYEVIFLTESGAEITFKPLIKFTPGKGGHHSIEEMIETIMKKDIKLITKWPKDLEDDFKADELDIDDPEVVERFGISRVVKVLSIVPEGRCLRGMKKWAGVFPQPRKSS